MSEVNLRIDNMHCGACVRRVTQTLNSIPGVQVDDVQIGAARVHVTGDTVTPETIVAAVAKAGYPTHVEQQ
ncbi:MAG TPA: heavy metal-associated domain-containing protein [Acidisarcina sp.]|nr:heavy metal-associated domain-containing protein [Acidisarcina sp.]